MLLVRAHHQAKEMSKTYGTSTALLTFAALDKGAVPRQCADHVVEVKRCKLSGQPDPLKITKVIYYCSTGGVASGVATSTALRAMCSKALDTAIQAYFTEKKVNIPRMCMLSDIKALCILKPEWYQRHSSETISKSVGPCARIFMPLLE